MVKTTASVPMDRLLAIIDTLADSEGRMKWATNKRLHFEIGMIKAIQSLNNVLISDVIKALAGAGSIEITNTPTEPVQENPTKEPQPVAAAPEPTPDPTPKPQTEADRAPWDEPKQETSPALEPVATPELEPAPIQQSAPAQAEVSQTPADEPEVEIKGLAALIDEAPDEAPASIPTPKAKEKTVEEEVAPAEEAAPVIDESFYEDPLIQKALEVFEGTLKQ